MRLLTWLFGEPEVIPARDGSDGTYLIRWYVFRIRRFGGLYIHYFNSSDDAYFLHGHPWAWSLSFILRGGYFEEYRVGDAVERRELKPGRFNWITKDTYHRVDLRTDGCWSLFLIGPTVDTWYFWDRKRFARAHARTYLDDLDKGTNNTVWQIDQRRW